jgi:DNA-binding CsgD family transcriptional regulator
MMAREQTQNRAYRYGRWYGASGEGVSAAYSAAVAGQAPLIGRGAESSELEAQFRQALRGEFCGVLIDGESGVGKTRLAAEFLRRHRARAVTLRTRGYRSGAAAAFGLWAELFDGHLRGRSRDEVTRLCGGFVEDLAGLLRTAAGVRGSWRSDVLPMRIREALTVLLGNIARERPAIILLDDMHLADASSWELLGYLARNLADTRVFVVVCARLEELVEPSVGRHVLFGLEQENVLTRILLQPLQQPHMRELAERVLARPSVPPTLVAWVWAESQGNPLFAVTLLQALVNEGADLAAPSLARIPQALSDRIAARIEGLDPPAGATLDLLAVVGRPVNIDELRRFGAEATSESDSRLQLLVEAGLVTEGIEEAEPLYEVGHPLIQEAIYRSLPAPYRRSLHQRVARVLVESDRLGEAASHYGRYAQRGDTEAIVVLLRALRRAWSRHTFAEAFVILGSLLTLLPSGDQRWVEVLDAMPPNAEWVSSYNRIAFDTTFGVMAFREIERTLKKTDPISPNRLAQVNSYLAGLLGWCLGEVAEAAARAAAAVELFERAGDAARARTASFELSWIEGLARRYAAQETATRQVLAAAEAAADQETILVVLASLATTAHIRGDDNTAGAALERSIALAKAVHNTTRLRFDLAILSGMVAHGGQLDRARQLLQEAEDIEHDSPDAIVREAALRLSWLAGEFSLVASEAPRVAALCAPMQQCWLLTYAAMAAAETGDFTAAHLHLETIRQLGRKPFWIISDHFDWAAGRVALAEGNLDTAVRRLEAAATAFRDTGALPYASYVLADLAEAAALAVQPAVAVRAMRAADDAAHQLDRDQFRALSAIAAAAANLTLGQRATATTNARKAVALLSGRGYHSLEADSLALLGRSLSTVDRPEAIDRLRRAAELFATCGSKWRRDQVLADLNNLGKPGQRAAASCLGPTTLTDREREIAALAAQGLTAKAIGLQLHIGERTAETHLARIYAKFNVHTRHDLLHALARMGLDSNE